MCVLSPLQPQGSLCATVQRALWVRAGIPLNFPVQELFLELRQTCLTQSVLVCSEPREVELNGSCLSCHSECQLQAGGPTCHGPVGSIFTLLITDLTLTRSSQNAVLPVLCADGRDQASVPSVLMFRMVPTVWHTALKACWERGTR